MFSRFEKRDPRPLSALKAVSWSPYGTHIGYVSMLEAWRVHVQIKEFQGPIFKCFHSHLMRRFKDPEVEKAKARAQRFNLVGLAL